MILPDIAKTFAPAQVAVRPEWLAQVREDAIDPTLPIVDAHHHLWDRPGQRYLFDDFLADTRMGHHIVGSVFVQCRSMYRQGLPDALSPVGETEFANGIAAQSASGLYGPLRACAGIVGFADLSLGSKVQDVLRAHLRAAPDRFRGVRNMTASDPSPDIAAGFGKVRPGMLREPAFWKGFAELAPLGLSADLWAYHPQLPEVIALAKAFPETAIVVNHAGGPLNLGPYRHDRAKVLAGWRGSLEALAGLPNVSIKLGGLCMVIGGLDLHRQPEPPGSEALADLLRPLVLPCIDIFGPDRCMFESNFSMDKGMCSYGVLWNAFKRITADFDAAKKTALFSGTATRIYRLDL